MTLPYVPKKAPQRGERIELTIESLSSDGAGQSSAVAPVGPEKIPRKFRFEVDHALPGEVVEVEVRSVRRRLITTRPLALLKSSPLRQNPRCSHAGTIERAHPSCGGCVYQHIDYPTQLAFKRTVVENQLANVGIGDVEVPPLLPAASPWFYRNKMEYSVTRALDGSPHFGLFPRGYRYDVLPLAHCFLLSPFASTLLPHIGEWIHAQALRPYDARSNEGFLRTITLREGKRTGKRMIVVTTSGDSACDTAFGRCESHELVDRMAHFLRDCAAQQNEALTSILWIQQCVVPGVRTEFRVHLLSGASHLDEELHLSPSHKLSFAIHPLAFFQPNTLQAETLYKEVIRAALSDRHRVERLFDLYCGTGTIALCLAGSVDEVVGVEINPDAVSNAQSNAIRNQIDNATFHCGDVSAILKDKIALNGGRNEVVIIDPPRSGLTPPALRELLQLALSRLVYLSCNPTALARDLVQFIGAGYRIASIQPVDMFPQTPHIETVVALDRSHRV